MELQCKGSAEIIAKSFCFRAQASKTGLPPAPTDAASNIVRLKIAKSSSRRFFLARFEVIDTWWGSLTASMISDGVVFGLQGECAADKLAGSLYCGDASQLPGKYWWD